MVIELINSIKSAFYMWNQNRLQYKFQQRMIDRYGTDWLEKLTR